jgi:hypothetical protein
VSAEALAGLFAPRLGGGGRPVQEGARVKASKDRHGTDSEGRKIQDTQAFCQQYGTFGRVFAGVLHSRPQPVRAGQSRSGQVRAGHSGRKNLAENLYFHG